MTTSFNYKTRSFSLSSISHWLMAAALCWSCSGSSESADANADANGMDNLDGEQQLPVNLETEQPADEGLPVDSGNAAGGTSLNIFELLETEQCQAGWIDEVGPNCNARFRDICFETDEAACECAGCGDACLIAESFPTQISCQSPLPGID